MFDYLDVLLAFALIVLSLWLIYKMYRSDRALDEARDNRMYVYHHESSYDEYRRERRRMKKYGFFAGIIFVLIFYSVLRMNGTINSIF